MNTEIERWVMSCKNNLREQVILEQFYHYLQANPHLLRDDGEKDELPEWPKELDEDISKYFGEADATEAPPPHRPTNPVLATYTEPISGQNMEQEAREMLEKHHVKLDILSTVYSRDNIKGSQADRIITALTEFGKMWYERGSSEVYNGPYKHLLSCIAEFQQQLTEKYKEIYYLREGNQHFIERINQVKSELTAAKEQIAKLEQQNADLELALKNM